MIARVGFRSWTAAFVSGAAVFVADQWLKSIFFDRVNEESGAFSFLGGLVRSTLHHNYGISFNISIPIVIIIIITGIALGWALALLIERAKTGHVASCIIIGVFIGGVLGNALDRLTLGFVRDWLLLFGRSAVNLADGTIAGSLLVYIFRSDPLDK